MFGHHVIGPSGPAVLEGGQGHDGREGGAVEPQRPHGFGRRSPELMRSLGAGGFGVFRLGEFFRELVKLGL